VTIKKLEVGAIAKKWGASLEKRGGARRREEESLDKP